MKAKSLSLLLIAVSVMTVSCQPATLQTQKTANTEIFQYAPIELLLAGQYDGELTVGELRKHGSLGVGTFNRLDGEMVMLDGRVWQVKSDGRVYSAGDEMRLPFAVAAAEPDSPPVPVGPIENLQQLNEALDSQAGDVSGIFVARINGPFRYVRVRSVPAQDKPYKRLADAVKGQTVFEYRNISGTIVAFRYPDSTGTINVPGWHMHFISDDRKTGGHVLDVRQDGVVVRLRGNPNLHLRLPAHSSPLATQPAGNTAMELHRIEK